MRVWNTTCRPLPADFALYIAMSALRSRCSVSPAPTGDADTGRDEQVIAVDRKRHAERFRHRGGDLLGLVGRRHALEQHGELVAAKPRDGIGRARALDEPLRGGLQQPVADVVAERVIDVLEVVEVDHQHGEAVLRAPRQVERVLHAVAEQAPVRKQCQRIVEGELPELVLEGLALGDVAQVQREALHGRVVSRCGRRTPG